jgi:hypothetical protein
VARPDEYRELSYAELGVVFRDPPANDQARHFRKMMRECVFGAIAHFKARTEEAL